MMENYTLDKDIKTFYITAASFPDGVMAAHEQLHALVGNENKRRFFGISRPEGGKEIVYKAATEELYTGEADDMKCDTFIIKSSSYNSIVITDFMQHIPAIGEAFQQLLAQLGIDPDGACIEEYFNATDVRCMVRLTDK